MEPYIVEMRHITKQFGNYKANNDISLQVKRGEILALLGENGAGKSTLMGMLSGLLEPTAGQIMINGQAVKLAGPRAAKRLGIGMVHQHFMLIPAFSVLENIILGDEPTQGLKINYRKAAQEIKILAQKYHLEIDLQAKVKDITVGMQQRVEIMKALYRKANVFIFDEPTAALTPQEIEQLIKIFRTLAAEGKSVIFITHKLKEIKEVADRCVVIRMGKVVATVQVNETAETSLAEMMVGHQVKFTVAKKETDQTKRILEVKDLTVEIHGQKKVENLSLTVHQGEIVGVAGVDGNGQSELIAALTGLTKIKTGQVVLNDHQLQHKNARQISQLGIGCIPEDRQQVGLILPLTTAENLMLKNYYRRPASKYGWLNYRMINQRGRQLIKDFDIRTQTEKAPVADLSGGNQQKVIVAREISAAPELLIAANPTRGIDIGAIEYIHEKITEQRNLGHGVLLVSFELDEILKLSDRVVVMHAGQIVGEIDPAATTSEELGLLMAGKVPTASKSGGR
ncbi:MAG: ABC transporter ATP-binding protein [Liquorilactobacillus ghanensis]|uniref:ABC transporter ATP-binding protein n=1 Tax=Liquorilactobacillus ghanensis TaxID=399370 RepID=UPI0039E9EBFF